jgi:hypothetical protein
MQKRSIWFSLLVSCFVVSANALADDVLIVSCGTTTHLTGPPICPPCPPPDEGINVASISTSMSHIQPSVAVGDPCAAAISNLVGIGFKIFNIAPVGAGSPLIHPLSLLVVVREEWVGLPPTDGRTLAA